MKFKTTRVYYYSLVLIAIIFPLTQYPRIYGTDSFQVIWMANALREGALFSNNTWLISPLSYFGYYPFSHRAIGVPLILAFIMSFLEFVSFGIFGIAEAILTFNIILILIIYKSSRNLGNILFKEEWSRFIFVTAIILSQYMLGNVVMTVSTRVIITIIMIYALNLNIKIITNSIKAFKAIVFMFLLLIIGALAHKLWVATFITIVIMIFTALIRKIKNLQYKFIRKYKNLLYKLTVFLILPLSIIAFFIGLELLNAVGFDLLSSLDPDQTFSPFFDVNTLFGMGILLSWFYVWNLGVISIFFPVGVIITLYELAKLLKHYDKKNARLNYNRQLLQKYYLILFIIPFSFLLPYTFYSIVIFFPILIIFSVYGIIFIKKFISTYSETSSWLLLAILLFISIGYSFIKVEFSTKIDLWFVYVLSFISLILLLFVFITKKYRTLNFSKISLDSLKMKKEIWILILTISILIFSITTIETNRAGLSSSPYPWENRYLTDEEIGIIYYFQNEEIDGLIFTTDIYIAERISSISLLPTFYARSNIGKALWYDLLKPKEVIEGTMFSLLLSNIIKQRFFIYRPEYVSYYFETSPLELIRRQIIHLNMTIERDRDLVRSEYNVQYIISINRVFSHEGNQWTLIQSLYKSELEPVFSTQHLLVWKIL
ncbi:MAG: hypothetical protein HWN80_06205 [Candidatus Lokiarchaeota archaeon]|nr:hypothetical protein [Candidatus Lokiarchaeota archaeon]